MKIAYMLIFLICLPVLLQAQYQEVPYTLADRDRLIQIEANGEALRNEMNSLRNEMNSLRNEMDSLRNEMNARLDAVNSKIDYLFWMMGVIVALIIFMLGYMIWDRRTTLNPVRNEVEFLKFENEKIKDVFRRQSESQPQLKEILKNAGIL